MSNRGVTAVVAIILLAAAAAWFNRGLFMGDGEPAGGQSGKGGFQSSLVPDAAALLRDGVGGGAAAADRAHAALDDPRPQVREAAVVSLGHQPALADPQRLARAASQDSSPEVRGAAVDVLARQDRWENMPALIAGLRDKEESVRRRAHRAIRDMMKVWIPFDPAGDEEARERDVSNFERSCPAMESHFRDFQARKAKEKKP